MKMQEILEKKEDWPRERFVENLSKSAFNKEKWILPSDYGKQGIHFNEKYTLVGIDNKATKYPLVFLNSKGGKIKLGVYNGMKALNILNRMK